MIRENIKRKNKFIISVDKMKVLELIKIEKKRMKHFALKIEMKSVESKMKGISQIFIM